ncbi:MAG: hypothetical protein AB7O50_08270 [Pseudolabrys sp.]
MLKPALALAAFALVCAIAHEAHAQARNQQRAACPAPYRVLAPDGRCVWSCASGTRPDPRSNSCICQDGHVASPVRSGGRLVCIKRAADAPARPGTPLVPIRPDAIPRPGGPLPALKAPARIVTPAQWTRRRGAKMNLFAVLLDQQGAPIANAATSFVVRTAGSGSRTVHSCRPRSDRYGRVQCLVPISMALDDYNVEVSYAGSPQHAPATGTFRILGQNQTTFEVDLPGSGGTRIDAEPHTGGFSEPNTLRAVVTRGGQPLANQDVEFAAGGVRLGTARTNSAGIAQLGFRPSAPLLRQFLRTTNVQTGQQVGLVGALEYWHLPASGAPAVKTAFGEFRFTGEDNLCSRLNYDGETRGYQRRCTVTTAAQRNLVILREAGITVQQNRFGQADNVAEAHYRIEFPQPEDPPPNQDCNASVIGVANACRTSCSRLEYLTFSETGSIASLRGAPGGARCGWALATEAAPGAAATRAAHDACALAAARQGLSRWNHDVTVTMPVRVAGAFGFIDAHTRGTRGNWQYTQFLQYRVLDTRFDVTVRVNCR